MNPIKVLVVDDESDWTAIIADIIRKEQDILLAGTAADMPAALEFVRNAEADVVILDLFLGSDAGDGIDGLKEILKIKPLKVIVLSSYKDPDIVVEAFRAGAVNFINKQHCREIPARIRDTYQGDSRVEDLLAEFKRLDQEMQLRVLTPTERKIYDLRVQGSNYREIGAELFIETRTVKNHINHILKKLNRRRLL